VDARVDVRTGMDGVLTVTGGLAHLNSSIELTPIGAAQGRNWTYTYAQARYRAGDFFAQAYVNHSNAGESFLLRDGNAIIDKSLLFVAQAQHGTSFGERLKVRFGGDLIRTVPRTEGTISGAFEDDDELLEVGGYAQAEVDVFRSVSVIATGRVDHHNRVRDLVFSPRAAIVVRPTEFHSLRLTYNRAFSQPSAQSLFLDLASSPSLGPFSAFGVRATGVPYETGFSFRRDCGGLCMYSPFAADPAQPLQLDVAPYWQDAVDQLDAVTQQITGVGLSPSVEALLRSVDPSGQVGTVVRKFDTALLAFGQPLNPETAVRDIAPLAPSITNTLEFGFKGFLPPRLFLSLDLYATRYENFIAPLAIETPNAFLNPDELNTFLRPTLEANGLSAAQAGQLIGTLATVPLGTVTPQEVNGAPTDLYVTVRNFGQVDLWGADVALGWPITSAFQVSATYSYVSRNFFRDVDDIADVALNAPRHKGSLAVRYEAPRKRFAAEARGRYINGFDVRSGVYVGTIEPYTLVDLNVNYVVPFVAGMEVTASASNVFDKRHREIIGAPEIGRMIYFSVGQQF
jgi:iron complex outermembrane receptor protein